MGNTVLLADHVDGSDYIDNTWNEALAGMSNIVLVNRQGQRLCDGPSVPTLDIEGLGSIIAEDGNPHLLVFNSTPTNFVRDYDISNHCFNTNLAISLNRRRIRLYEWQCHEQLSDIPPIHYGWGFSRSIQHRGMRLQSRAGL